MYHTLPYMTWQPTTATAAATSIPDTPPSPPPFLGRISTAAGTGNLIGRREDVKRIVKESAVVVLGRRGCCMSHVVKQLLLGLGVNPAVYEVDEEDEKGVVKEFLIMEGDHADISRQGGVGDGEKGPSGDVQQLPAVFIGGKLFGGLERIMAVHITGELTPILREARALWL